MSDIKSITPEVPFPAEEVMQLATHITNAAGLLVEQTSEHNEEMDQDFPTMTFEEAVMVINTSLSHLHSTITNGFTAYAMGMDSPLDEDEDEEA